MNDIERESKRVIALAMGEDFVTAIYDATTSETLVKNFGAALEVIASICRTHGRVGTEVAANILAAYNPGHQYNIRVFNLAVNPPFAPRPLPGVGEHIRIRVSGVTGVITGRGFTEGSEMCLVALDNPISLPSLTIRVIVVHPNCMEIIEDAAPRV